jgi:hypothetical protein
MIDKTDNHLCCFIDESIHDLIGFVTIAFVFSSNKFESNILDCLKNANLNPPHEEFKSSFKMDSNPKTRIARDNLLSIASSESKFAIFFVHLKETKASLGWALLMRLRHSLFTWPIIISNGGRYNVASDPVILDPMRDDPAKFFQYPILLGWGIQVDPKTPIEIGQVIEKEFGLLWLGCIH